MKLRKFVTDYVVIGLLLLILYYILYFIVNVLSFRYLYKYNIQLSYALLGIALIIGGLNFIISKFIKKVKTNAIISSIQVFCVFAALPYILPLHGWGIFFYGYVSRIQYTLISILPEILGFLGCVWIKKRRFATGLIFVATAILLAVEIYPVRMIFHYDAFSLLLNSPYNSEKMLPFGKADREFEFKRSLKIIEELAEKSKKDNSYSKKKIVICFPNLTDYPNILKNEIPNNSKNYRTEKYWRYLQDNFVKKELWLNTQIDSDGDGLSDFKEAELLSDAYDADTDDDGINDGSDTDPLNQYIKSDYATIKTLVLKKLKIEPDSNACYLIDNEFYDGHGEFDNFNNHIVILPPDQLNKWVIMFGEQYLYCNGLQRGYFSQRIYFGSWIMSLTRHIAIIGVEQFHGPWEDSSGLAFMLVKFKGKWYLIARNLLWI